MKKFVFLLLIVVIGLTAFEAWRWKSIEPSTPAASVPIKTAKAPPLPEKNKKILAYVEANGRTVAPEYHAVVCTEFLINVLDKFEPLTKKEKRDIRIITDEDLSDLIEKDAPIIKGVQTALVNSGKGIVIEDPADVLPGDLVQFWDTFYGGAWGHCGIVAQLEPTESLTLHSSHPFTSGYGIQQFEWPDKAFFVRLRPN